VERKAALAQVAEMEADVLQQLDRVRNKIIENNDDKQKQKQFLKVWSIIRYKLLCPCSAKSELHACARLNGFEMKL